MANRIHNPTLGNDSEAQQVQPSAEVRRPVESYEKHQEHLARLQQKWNSEVSLIPNRPVVVTRGMYNERGLDTFILDSYDPTTGAVALHKDSFVGHEVKTFNGNSLRAFNNPVRTAKEWHDLYYATTGYANPNLINQDLMTIDDFCRNLPPNIQLDPTRRATWETARQQYELNLQRVEALDTEQRQEFLRRQITFLSSAQLDPSELPSMLKGNVGRRVIFSGKDPIQKWQGRTYSDHPISWEEHGREHWRMYMQVETEDIPRMVNILRDMGQRRVARGRGETLDFKFCTGVTDPETMLSVDGDYAGVRDEQPRVVVYFKDQKQRSEFLRELMAVHREDILEMSEKRQYIGEDGQVHNKARRPGASVVYDSKTGREIRCINVNDDPGYSEDRIERLEQAGQKWRNVARGSLTTFQERN